MSITKILTFTLDKVRYNKDESIVITPKYPVINGDLNITNLLLYYIENGEYYYVSYGIPEYTITKDQEYITQIKLIPTQPLNPNYIYSVRMKNVRGAAGAYCTEYFTSFFVNYEIVRNKNDIFYQINNYDKLFDVDHLNKIHSIIDYTLVPSYFDNDTKKYNSYIDEDGENISVELQNSVNLRNIYLNEFLYEYRNFFSDLFNKNLINSNYTFSEEEIKKINVFFLKNIDKFNKLKGSLKLIEFVLGIYARVLGYQLISVIADPSRRFQYRVTTSIPTEFWKRNLKSLIHPCGWDDIYNETGKVYDLDIEIFKERLGLLDFIRKSFKICDSYLEAEQNSYVPYRNHVDLQYFFENIKQQMEVNDEISVDSHHKTAFKDILNEDKFNSKLSGIIDNYDYYDEGFDKELYLGASFKFHSKRLGTILSRSSSATYKDFQGHMKISDIDKERYSYHPITHQKTGYLLEEERTNFVLSSNPDYTWYKSDNSKLNVSTEVTSLLSLESVEFSNIGTPGDVFIQTNDIEFEKGKIYTSSIYVKIKDVLENPGIIKIILDSNIFGINNELNVDLISRSIVPLNHPFNFGKEENNNQWLRIWLTSEAITSGTSYGFKLQWADSNLGNIKKIYVFGAQVEEGRDASSLIITNVEVQTRSVDIFVDNKPVYELEYKHAGYATDYIWKIYYTNNLLDIERTAFGKYTLDLNRFNVSDIHKIRVVLELRNPLWSKEVYQFDSSNCFKHKTIIDNWLARSSKEKYLSLYASEKRPVIFDGLSIDVTTSSSNNNTLAKYIDPITDYRVVCLDPLYISNFKNEFDTQNIFEVTNSEINELSSKIDINYIKSGLASEYHWFIYFNDVLERKEKTYQSNIEIYYKTGTLNNYKIYLKLKNNEFEYLLDNYVSFI